MGGPCSRSDTGNAGEARCGMKKARAPYTIYPQNLRPSLPEGAFRKILQDPEYISNYGTIWVMQGTETLNHGPSTSEPLNPKRLKAVSILADIRTGNKAPLKRRYREYVGISRLYGRRMEKHMEKQKEHDMLTRDLSLQCCLLSCIYFGLFAPWTL